MAEIAITSLAILKVNWEQGLDYIENFVPFVADCLRTASRDEVSLPELQESVLRTFGFRIPQGALRTILSRASKRGLVEITHGVYRRKNEVLAHFDIGRARGEALRRHEALVAKLQEFCSREHEVNWSRDEAEANLLGFLVDRSSAILTTAVEGQPIIASTSPTRKAEYLVSRFIELLSTSDPEGFEFLVTLVKGSMLVNVLFFPELGTAQRRFEHVEVYLDTAVLLRALGYAGPGMRAPCQELMSLLYELNAGLRCFEHTVEEIRGILDAAAHALGDRNRLRQPHGETIEFFIDSGYGTSDVEFMISRLDQSLRSLRVQVKPSPPYEARLGMDERKLESILQDEVGYQRQEALHHDLDSLAAIHRLRRGQFPMRIESCGAIFVTANSSLARASHRFFQKEYGNIHVIRVPNCVLDHALTTLAWLKKPTRAPDLPRKKIIADCYAALNPPDSLWKRYLDEIRRLQERGDISGDDYNLLRFSTEAKSILTDATLGDADAFAEGTVEEVLRKARAAVVAGVEAERAAEASRREEAERAATEARTLLEAVRQARSQRFEYLGVRISGVISSLVMYGLVLGLAFAAYLARPKRWPPLPEKWSTLLGPLTLLALVVLDVLTILNLSVGITLRSSVKRFEVRLAHFIEVRLKRLMEPGGHTE